MPDHRSSISIISPCYNAGDYFVKFVESVIGQTHKDWRLIIVDDGSNDGTLELARHYAIQDERIFVLSTSGRMGASHARNLGIDHAQEKYIAFLDVDDWWLPHHLEETVDFMETENRVFCFSSYFVYDQTKFRIRLQGISGELSLSRYIRKAFVIGCLTVMVDREFLGSIRFVRELPKAEDFLFWCQILKKCEDSAASYGSKKGASAVYRLHNLGKSKNKLVHALAHWGIYRKQLGFNFFRSLISISSYATNGMIDRVSSWYVVADIDSMLQGESTLRKQ